MLKLLQKYEPIFDGTLGNYTGSNYKIELREGVKPYHAKPFPIPKVHEETLRKEVNKLDEIGVLKQLFSNIVNKLLHKTNCFKKPFSFGSSQKRLKQQFFGAKYIFYKRCSLRSQTFSELQ